MTSRDKLNLFPSRANYVFVKQRMVSAQKGLELLKRKRDALELKLREYKAHLNTQQQTADESVRAAIFSMARLEYLGTDLKPQAMLNVSQPDVYLRFSFMKTIGVVVPQFEVALQKARSYPLTGLGRGGTEVPKVRQKFQEALEQVTKLASIDYAVKVLEKGVHQNNMRINGLEFVVLPRYQNTLTYIRDELDEFEREDFYRLKKGQAKRLKKQQEEIENMRYKLEDPENFTKKIKKEREAKLKNMPNWKKVFTNKMEAVSKARYDMEQAKEAAKRQLEAEELYEEEFEDEYGEFEFEGLEEDDDDDKLGEQIFDWAKELDESLKLGDSLRSTLKSYAIDDPDTAEGSREIMQSRSVLTPPTFLKGSNSNVMEPRSSSIDLDPNEQSLEIQNSPSASTTQLQQQTSKAQDVEPQSGSMVQTRETNKSLQQSSKSQDIGMPLIQSRNISTTQSQGKTSKAQDVEQQSGSVVQTRETNLSQQQQSGSVVQSRNMSTTQSQGQASKAQDLEQQSGSVVQSRETNKSQQQVSKAQEQQSGSVVQSKSQDVEPQSGSVIQSRERKKPQQQSTNTNDAEQQNDDENPTSSTPPEKDANKKN